MVIFVEADLLPSIGFKFASYLNAVGGNKSAPIKINNYSSLSWVENGNESLSKFFPKIQVTDVVLQINPYNF